MSQFFFLREDKKDFEDYAIQGTIITLKHYLYLEKFNFTYKKQQKKLGVPITKSSVGLTFVL